VTAAVVVAVAAAALKEEFAGTVMTGLDVRTNDVGAAIAMRAGMCRQRYAAAIKPIKPTRRVGGAAAVEDISDVNAVCKRFQAVKRRQKMGRQSNLATVRRIAHTLPLFVRPSLRPTKRGGREAFSTMALKGKERERGKEMGGRERERGGKDE
jgi:hypothetical protein